MPYRSAYTPTADLRDRWMLRIGSGVSVFLVLSLAALIWLGTFYFTEGLRRQTEKAALQNITNLSSAFEEQIIRSFRAADQTLLYVRDAYARDPDNFDMSLWSRNSEFLSGIDFQVVIIGKNGLMVASNIPGSRPGLDLNDREHFKIHTQRDTDELFISKPVFGRVSKKWSVQLTRRITMSDGSFGGVAVVSVDPAYLATYYKSINVGEDGSVTLMGTDGIIRARGANGPSMIGESLIASPAFAALRYATHGTFRTHSQFDGKDRIYGYRAVRGYPLVVVVGLSTAEVFRDYNKNYWRGILAAAAMTLWLIVVTFLMWRYERMLTRSRDAAEAGTRARSEFLAMMSHEIRTPMNGVVGMTELLMDSGLNAEQAAYATTLKGSANHLLQVINDVLDFSKLDANRIEIEQVTFDLHELVQVSVGLLQTVASEKDLSLTVDIAPDVPRWISGDPARLRQVLFNLVGNGLKFTHSGGVTVAITNGKEAMLPGHLQLAFAVTDTGMGIPKDGLPLLFQEFSQLDSSIARRFGGTGLGLAICRRLIGLMGGSIAVESEVGKGTTFRFTVHCRSADAPRTDVSAGRDALAALAVVSPQDAKAVRILLVEDNKTNQFVAKKMLEKLGYTADIANDGTEAIAACQAKAYDVIFMDMMMPGIDGLSATRAIRRMAPPFVQPHIVALTASAQDTDRALCLAAGMDDYLSKPVTRHALAEKLNRFSAPSVRPAMAASPADEPPAFDKALYYDLLDAIGTDGMVAVLEAFLSDTPVRIAEMRRAARENENDKVKIDAHAIKSSAASIGFMRLSRMAKALEQECAGLSGSALSARVDEFERCFAEADLLGHAQIGGLTRESKEIAGVQ